LARKASPAADRLGRDRSGELALKLVECRNTTASLLAARRPDRGLMLIAFIITTPPVAG
jgi:hypothetical protein